MTTNQGVAIVEALLFASGEPISAERIAAAAKIDVTLTEKLIRELEDRFESVDSALTVLRLDNAYQLAVRRDFYEYIRGAFDQKRIQPLSQAALEALTIIAYNQPVTKSFVEHVRGVDSSSLINTLAEKGLLEEAGRLDVPGKPIAYRTTDVFLRAFGIESLADLPPIPAANGEQIVIEDAEETLSHPAVESVSVNTNEIPADASDSEITSQE
jgi:segregation and condensation protein B